MLQYVIEDSGTLTRHDLNTFKIGANAFKMVKYKLASCTMIHFSLITFKKLLKLNTGNRLSSVAKHVTSRITVLVLKF